VSAPRDLGLREVRIVKDGWYTRFRGLATWGELVPSVVVARKASDAAGSAAEPALAGRALGL
jgi:hypothetical protein